MVSGEVAGEVRETVRVVAIAMHAVSSEVRAHKVVMRC